jgi:hypothetical protein
MYDQAKTTGDDYVPFELCAPTFKPTTVLSVEGLVEVFVGCRLVCARKKHHVAVLHCLV